LRKLLRLASLVIFFRMGRTMLSFIIGVLRVEWVEVSKLADDEVRTLGFRLVVTGGEFKGSKLTDDEDRTLGFRLVITRGDGSTASM
jgi:hypothetical protein